MNTILLVDDDEYVINGLLKHIPWEQMGVRIVGTAADGAEGLVKFRELAPDFVITDIYMPVMDGFQLTEAIHEIKPGVPIVILSGYDDLANARKAVSSGIHHFLLKPPSITEIEFVVREVLQQLHESQEREDLLASYLAQQEVVRRSMKDAFFRSLLMTRYRAEELPAPRIEFMGLPKLAQVQVLTLHLVRSQASGHRDEREWQLLRFGTGNIVREQLDVMFAAHSEASAEIVQYSDREFVVIVLGASIHDASFQSKLTAMFDSMLENILRYMKLSVMAGLGTVRTGYEHLIDSYLESRKALETAEMNEWNRVYKYEEIAETDPRKTVPLDSVRDVHDAILQKQWMQTLELWKRLSAELAVNYAPLPVLKGVCTGIVSALWTAVQSAMQHRASGGSDDMLESLLVQISGCSNGRELLQRIDETVAQFVHQIREELQGKVSHALVDRVIKDYIEKCYHEEITLEKIAANLHVNRNYLSHLFKRITGEPFVTYFNRFRIEKAKELIATGNYMVYEVSELVGFQNSTYFSQVFKSIVGCSPSEYRP